MSEDHKKQLEQQLWNIANTLRGKMNADEFRDYILGFIFYKYLSEKMEIYADTILKPDGISYTDIEEETENGKAYLEAIKEEALIKLGYFLKPSELFSAVAKRGNHKEVSLEEVAQAADPEEDYQTQSNFILEDLQTILNNVQNSTMGTESEEDFDNLFEDLDLNSTKLGKNPSARNEIIAKVLGHLNKIDFKLEQTELDVLGDAYEYLIGKFASGAGKKAGEFYTPQEVSIVLAKLVTTGKTKLKSVYDPTCGSGSLLLRVAKEVKEVNDFYGQELNRTTYNLARMNMILHGVHYRKFDIKQEDTLEYPQHIDERFEAIVANPPFSAKWSANKLFMSDDRFSQYGKLAPKSKADYAFVQHMVHQLAENGTMALVLPHGALFRGSAEGHIREYLIKEKNFLDAVIGLPANIFYGTSIPTCIMVFKKCRENPDDILFIDASEHYEKVKTQNVLTENNIGAIVATYRMFVKKQKLQEGNIKLNNEEWENNENGDFQLKINNSTFEIDKYSYVASLEEVAENDYNLNIPRYVDTFEEEEPVDIDAVANEIESLNSELQDNKETITSFCEELNIKTPF
ncbi:MAG: type I restriction-modification system subunit M [Mesonia sp.]|uniref:type I restriction-modification system subunit M n=1 Tax=Mesonia sp. TaxID=1960830 RepID=UPI003F9B014B